MAHGATSTEVKGVEHGRLLSLSKHGLKWMMPMRWKLHIVQSGVSTSKKRFDMVSQKPKTQIT